MVFYKEVMSRMLSIDEAAVILDEIAAELPKEFYNHLNGGILLMPEAKIHPESKARDLYILGTYHNERDLGRYIKIYYGSFERLYGRLPVRRLREKLKEVLVHEFTHHLESLAGERDLERKDAWFLAKYHHENAERDERG
jgi:predicted Zn-dependent protease with MMP-like domain